MSKFATTESRILLLRHCEAQANVHGAFLGHRDEPLTQKGMEQARALADALREEKVDALITSPLLRARQTAEFVARAVHVPIVEEARLIEQNYGAWEGFTFDEVSDRFPRDFAAWLGNAEKHGPSEGENLAQVIDRVSHFLDELDLEQGATYALVGHGSCLQALLCYIFGIPSRAIWPFRLANGSITEIRYVRGCPTMTRMSAQGMGA